MVLAAQNAGWDIDLLKIEMQDLSTEGFDLSLIGFGLGEMANMFDDGVRGVPESSAKEIDPDDYRMSCTCPKCGFEFDDK